MWTSVGAGWACATLVGLASYALTAEDLLEASALAVAELRLRGHTVLRGTALRAGQRLRLGQDLPK